jgi:hypothetical protein
MRKLLLIAGLLLLIGSYNTNFGQNKPNNPKQITYVLKGDGITDDTEALNAWGKGDKVFLQR